MKNLSIIVLTTAYSLAIGVISDPNHSLEYIEQYKDIAISEMERTGIPASIKLAQGLVESGAGKSTLSREANNHFGIKCNGGWEGETHYRKDDDYKNGKLIKSCFRKFSSPYESYIAHSDFLTTQRRYSSLFALARNDYRSWAKGLKKAGYATDSQYANKLINVIEKYHLHRYDENFNDHILVSKETDSKSEAKTAPPSAEIIADADARVNTQNQKSSSRRTSTQRTRKKSQDARSHRVRAGETLASIARDYDLDPTILRLRNRIPKNAEPLKGEKLHLRKNISLLKRPKFTRTPEPGAVASNDDFIF